MLYLKTIESIKNNDSISFQRLWEYPDSIANNCGDYPYNIFHEDALLRHFREVKTNWAPFLNIIKYYDVDIEKMRIQDVAEFGQEICYWVSIDKKKDKIFPIAARVVFHKNRLVYGLGCRLPDKVVD
ncbi:MAG: hypothetical protein JWO32_434 [Bacteroidetes bacterium]|nr:hypothetical protein [Bacteroidota bacterium]